MEIRQKKRSNPWAVNPNRATHDGGGADGRNNEGDGETKKKVRGT